MAMSNRLLLLLPFTILMAPVVVHSFTPSSSNNNNRCAVPQVRCDLVVDVDDVYVVVLD